MILLYELTQSGMSHAPFTRAFVQTVTLAFPRDDIKIYAQQSHLDAALGELDPVLKKLTQTAYIPPQVDGRAFFRRFFSALRLLAQTYITEPHFQTQVIFLSGDSHLIWAAKIFRWFHPGFRCHLVLHGDINSVQHPRGRNPFHRATDFVSSIGKLNHPNVRFVALETHIRDNLVKLLPGAQGVVDVIHHPCIPAVSNWRATAESAHRLRFGLLGIAGRSKGLDVFARLAIAARRDLCRAADFRLIGKVQAGSSNLDLSGISGPLPFSPVWLPLELFDSELSNLHYVVLPYNMDYYALSASGVLLDVLRWRKPIVSFDTPVIRELVERFGDIGYICKDEGDLVRTVDSLLSDFDMERYQSQRNNLDAAYRSRLPATASKEYSAMQEICWTTRLKVE